MQMNELQNALDRAKIGLMSEPNSGFFTTIAFSMKMIWDDTQPTAYVDGVHMGWNPNWFMKLTPDERIGVMVHEACHIAFDHLGRFMILKDQGWDDNLYGQAADHVINNMLEERGFKLPKPNLCEHRFKGMSTEEVYKILEAEQPPSRRQPPPMVDLRIGGGGQKDPQGGSGGPQHGMDPGQLQAHMQSIIVRASLQSQMAGDAPGTIPGEIQLYLDKLLNPILPWQTLLRRYFTEFSKNDYSWKRPNRRFFPAHHLPSLHSISLEEIDFYVDISGSVADYQFNMFVSEIAGVLKHHKPKAINIIQFDTEIKHINKVHNIQELMKVVFTGRGGTHIECILQHMERSKSKAKLVFTDGGFVWPRQTFRHPILWLINDNPKWQPTFGHAIHFSTKEFQP